MDIKTIISKPFKELTSDELTFLTSLGCNYCSLKDKDCARLAFAFTSCAEQVYRSQKLKVHK